jgi:hypothetical protein
LEYALEANYQVLGVLRLAIVLVQVGHDLFSALAFSCVKLSLC